MSYYHKYKNKPLYTCASAPTMSVHAPAQESELASPSGWYGDPTHSSPSTQLVESQAPTPNNFDGTQGYYHNGCWYNASIEQRASPQQQQQHQQQQQQHVPQYYIIQQPGQQQFMASAYPLQQQHVTSSYPSHQHQHQHQQLAVLPTDSYQQRQQQQIWPQSYPSQQQQQILPQPCQSQLVMSPAYPSQQQQQQQQHQLVLVPTYPSQGQQQQQQQQQHAIILQQCPYHQQRQIVPQCYQAQQLMSPQQQISLPAQQHHATPSCAAQQYQEVSIVSNSSMAPDIVTTPQAMLAPSMMQVAPQNQAPELEMESPRNQETTQLYPEAEAEEEGPQEATENPPDVLDMNLGPGVQATRSHNKLTIDIDLSHVDNGVPERRRCVDDVMRELVRLIRGCVFRNPLPRRRRNHFRLRHAAPRARPARDRVQRVLVADKETQAVEADEVVPSELDVPEAVQESPSSSQTLVTAELLSQPTLLQEQLLSEPSASSSPRDLFQAELCCEQPLAVDPIDDQTLPGLTDPKQPDNAQPMANGLDTSQMAMMSPQPKVETETPLLIPEPKKSMDEANSWPPLGTRAPAKARLVKKSISVNPKGSFLKPSQRFNENRSARPHLGTQRQVKGNSNDAATFQPKQILRNLERYGADVVKSNGDRAEAEAVKVPAGNLNDNSQALKAPTNRSLSSANDKKIPSKRQSDVAIGLQNKKHSIQSVKQKHPESKLTAGNMFALLEDPGVEPAPPEIMAEPVDQENDNVEALKLAAKRARKLKRKLKKKEKARAMRLEAREKKSVAPKGPTSSGNNSGKVSKPCEIHFLGELQVTRRPAIERKEKPLKFLLFRNPNFDESLNVSSTKTFAEISTITKPAEGADPKQPVVSPVESQEELASQSANRGRRRSHFLNAVAEYAVSKKSPEESPLPAKRNLWEKRRQPDQSGQPES